MAQHIQSLKHKIQDKTSECDSLTLRISYLAERERQEQNMFGQYKIPTKEQSEYDDDSKDEANIITVLDSKNKQIEEDFEKLKEKFLEIAEQKMDKIKQGDGILEEMDRIRKIYIDFKEQNMQLKSMNEILNSKLDAKNKLNEHLEHK